MAPSKAQWRGKDTPPGSGDANRLIPILTKFQREVALPDMQRLIGEFRQDVNAKFDQSRRNPEETLNVPWDFRLPRAYAHQ